MLKPIEPYVESEGDLSEAEKLPANLEWTLDPKPRRALGRAVRAVLNFKVEPEFHEAYKLAAALNKMSMKSILKLSFWIWQKETGGWPGDLR